MVTCGHVFNHVLNKSSVALPGGGNDCRSKPFSQNYQNFSSKLHRHVRVPTYPTRTNILLFSLYCFAGIPTGQLPCGSKWVQYPHLFIATACSRCTDHVIMCWKLRDSPEGSGITFAGLLLGLATTPQKPLQNLGRLLVVQQCRALWKFMTCFFQTPQNHYLLVEKPKGLHWLWQIYWVGLWGSRVFVWIEIYDDDHDDDGILSHITASLVHLSNWSSMAHIFPPFPKPLNRRLRQQICTSHCCQVLQAGIAEKNHGIYSRRMEPGDKKYSWYLIEDISHYSDASAFCRLNLQIDNVVSNYRH